MADLISYRDRTGKDPDQGAAIQVGTAYSERSGRREVVLELGVMRNFGSISADASASLTPDEARELAADLRRAAAKAEKDCASG